MKNNKNSSLIEIEDFTSVFRIITKNWYVIIIALIVSYTLSYLYTYKLTNVYAAQTQILLESNDQVNEESIISDNFGSYMNWWNKSTIDNTTEMRVIQSYDLVEKAINKMKLDVSYFIVGRIKTTEVYEGMPFNVNVLNINPDYYEKPIGFKIIDENKYRIVYTKNGEEQHREGKFNEEFVGTEFKLLIKNNSIFKESLSSLHEVEYYFEIHSISSLVSKFQSAMSVENPEMTNILIVKIEDQIPERAKDFLDTLSSVYIENSVKTRLDVNSNTLKYIEKQMNEVTQVLTHIEDTMQGYKENRGILDLTKEQDDYFKKMSEYDNQRSKLNLQIATLNSLESYIIEGKDPQFLPPSIYVISDDDYLKQSVTELYKMQIQINDRLTGSTNSNYNIIELGQKVSRLKSNLLIYITNSRKALKEAIVDVEKQISFYVSNIKTIPQKERELLSIERSFEVNQKMYLFLLEKKSNTIIGRAGILPETKVIESSRSVGIVRPDKQRIKVLFIGGGLFLAFLIIFVRFFFFSTIESVEELKKLTTLPVVGEILYSPSIKAWEIAVEMESKSPIAESFRTIRTNLQYMSTSDGGKSVVVTSNNPGEGKTFTSLNIAAILAKAGKKVIILELDLHKPKVQKALSMVADVGISSVVIGQSTIENSIKSTAIENMMVMLSGPIPPNPSEMVLSDKMLDILNYAKTNFDYVIIDTPPVALISDALVLMKQADIVLFVANTKLATKETIKSTNDIVEMNKIKNFGFILNGVKRKRSKYYYNKYSYGYGYGYGQGYGYGYGYGSKKE